MFEFLRRLFSRKASLPVSVTAAPAGGPDIVLNAEEIFTYLMRRDKDDRDGLRSEIFDRGLAFGDLIPDTPFGNQVRFRVQNKRNLIISDSYLMDVLSAILKRKGLNGLTLVTDSAWKSIRVEDTNIRSESEGGVWSSLNGQHKIFLEVRNSYSLEMSAYGSHGVSVIMSLVEALGFLTAPSMYRYESDVPLSEIVRHALVWHDKKNGRHYSEIMYDSSKKLSLAYLGGGPTKEFQDGSLITEVSGGAYPVGFRLNNLKVELTPVEEPTRAMLKARSLIREDQKKRCVCAVRGCGRKAAYDIYSVHFESGSIGSSSSMGSILKSCDSQSHVEIVKRMDPSLKQEVTPVREEVW